MTKYDLFISYDRHDDGWVHGFLLNALQKTDIRYLSEEEFRLGMERIRAFEDAILQSDRVLLIISPAYLMNFNNQFVDVLAQTHGLQEEKWNVIPLILQSVDLPLSLRRLVTLDATTPDKWEVCIERLCKQLQHPAPNQAAKPACPYPGMRPFEEKDSACFFGRDHQIKLLINRHLRQNQLVAVIGRSGSGKSSLVRAGLIPELRKSTLFDSGDWLVHVIRPSEQPLIALEKALGGRATDLSRTISKALTAHPHASRLLLVIDQFEEIFTLVQHDREVFQRALLNLTATPNCYLVITVRADFYPDLIDSLLWDKIKEHLYGIGSFKRPELYDAIVEPALKAGVWIDPLLVERLINDVIGAEESGVLPFLQEVLVLLWDDLERCYLPLQAYENFSHESGNQKLTGLQAAISYKADNTLAGLQKEQKAIARRIFLRLIQFGEGRPHTRRQQSVAALRSSDDQPEIFDHTLAHLVNARLLTLDRKEIDEQSRVDLAHEVIINSWSALQEWLHNRQEAEQKRRKLEEKASEWEKRGRVNRGLLNRDDLSEASRWLQTPDAKELGHSDALLTLVKKSQFAVNLFRVTASVLGITVLSLAGFAWNRQQQSEQDKLIRDAVLNVTTPNLVQRLAQRLPAYVKDADSAKTAGNIEQALASYQFLVALKRLEPQIKDASQTEEFANSAQDRQTIQEIASRAEKSLAAIIHDHKIPKLEADLKQGKIGDIRLIKSNPPEYASITELENQFTEGALRTTYEILMRQAGANADINKDGILTEGEELLLPCDTLEEIEQVWRQFTEGRCGWYGDEAYRASTCRELGKQSLLVKLIFPASIPLMEQRLSDQCQVVPFPESTQPSLEKP